MNHAWSRAKSGVIFGVCAGLAKRFQVDVLLIRLALIFSVLFFGFGLGVYFILALSLPREDKIEEQFSAKILGVCSRVAKRFELDVGLTRAASLFFLIGSGGVVFLGYVLLHFIFQNDVAEIKKLNKGDVNEK